MLSCIWLSNRVKVVVLSGKIPFLSKISHKNGVVGNAVCERTFSNISTKI